MQGKADSATYDAEVAVLHAPTPNGHECSPAPKVGPCIVHTVGSRETLNYLSIHYDVTPTDIRKANPGLSIGPSGSLEWCPTVKVPTSGGEKAPFRHCVVHRWCYQAAGGDESRAATAAAASAAAESAANNGRGGLRVAVGGAGGGAGRRLGSPTQRPPRYSEAGQYSPPAGATAAGGSLATLSTILTKVRQLTDGGNAADCTYTRVKRALIAEFGEETFTNHKADIVAMLEAHASATDALAQQNATSSNSNSSSSSSRRHVLGACRECGAQVPAGNLACIACGAVVRESSDSNATWLGSTSGSSSPTLDGSATAAAEGAEEDGPPSYDAPSSVTVQAQALPFPGATMSPASRVNLRHLEAAEDSLILDMPPMVTIAAPISSGPDGLPVQQTSQESSRHKRLVYNGVDSSSSSSSTGGGGGFNVSSPSPTNFLAAFDAKFSKARISAEKVIVATNTACLCCGIPLTPNASRPQSCPYYGLADPAAAAVAAKQAKEERDKEATPAPAQQQQHQRSANVNSPSFMANDLEDELFEL